MSFVDKYKLKLSDILRNDMIVERIIENFSIQNALKLSHISKSDKFKYIQNHHGCFNPQSHIIISNKDDESLLELIFKTFPNVEYKFIPFRDSLGMMLVYFNNKPHLNPIIFNKFNKIEEIGFENLLLPSYYTTQLYAYLKKVHFYLCEIDSDAVELICNLSSLECLIVFKCSTVANLDYLNFTETLKKLKIIYFYEFRFKSNFTEELMKLSGIFKFIKMPLVTQLQFEALIQKCCTKCLGIQIEKDCVSFKMQNNVNYLKYLRHFSVDSSEVRVNYELISNMLSFTPQLRSFKFVSREIAEEFAELFQKMPRLIKLDVAIWLTCPHLRPIFREVGTNCSRLRIFRFDAKKGDCIDSDLAVLFPLKYLRKLDLNASFIMSPEFGQTLFENFKNLTFIKTRSLTKASNGLKEAIRNHQNIQILDLDWKKNRINKSLKKIADEKGIKIII